MCDSHPFAKAHAVSDLIVDEKNAEIERLKQVLVKDDGGADGKASSSTKKKMKMLESELEIKTAALRDAEAQLATRTALVEDLENQLRSAGDASTARELNHQLRQMVLVHRQLLRKVRTRAGNNDAVPLFDCRLRDCGLKSDRSGIGGM